MLMNSMLITYMKPGELPLQVEQAHQHTLQIKS